MLTNLIVNAFESMASLVVGQNGSRDVHRIGALAHQHGVARCHFTNLRQRAVVAHRLAVVSLHRLDCRPVAIDVLGESCAPGCALAKLPGLVPERLVELSDNALGVAQEARLRRDIGAHLLSGDVDLEESHVWIETRRRTKVENPVQPRSNEKDHVGVL